MQRRWYGFAPGGLPRGAVVVDATLATESFWEGPIQSVLEELRDCLPAADHPDVVFLGDRRPYPLAAVLNRLSGNGPGDASTDYRQHLGRFPVAGPFLREWVRGSPRPVVLIANAPVHDLEDWAAPEIVAALVVFRLTGTERLTRPPFREIGIGSDLGVLVDHLRDPIREVRVGGNGAFVAEWRPADLTWEGGSVCGPGTAADALQLLLVHPDGHEPRAELTKTSGTRVACALTPTAPPAPAGPVLLSDADASVMRNWRSGHAFFCSDCRTAHAPGQLWCPSRPENAVIRALGDGPAERSGR